MLEDICDGSHYNQKVNIRDARNKITDCIRQRQSERKGALKSTQNIGKGLHKVFKTVLKEILQYYHLWENLVQKLPISFHTPEMFLKLQTLRRYRETLAKSQRGLVVPSEILRYFLCLGSLVQDRSFESLRTSGREDCKYSGPRAVANSHVAG